MCQPSLPAARVTRRAGSPWPWALLVAVATIGGALGQMSAPPAACAAPERDERDAGNERDRQLSGSRANVVLMVVDDQGLDAGCYGNHEVRTPHLDRLAAAGTRFTHAFCTTASCSASRSVILTGLHNHANGQFGHAHAPHNFHTHAWVASLPALLGRAGYRTSSVGKLHVQPESVYSFDEYLNEGTQGARHPLALAENVRRFIERDDRRPFFVYVCPSDPHRQGQGFANQRAYAGYEPTVYDPATISAPRFLPDAPEVRAEWAEYYQAVTRADAALGGVLDALDATGHADDTLVVYLSDNGAPFPGSKTTLYEPGMRLPLVIRRPAEEGGSSAATVSSALVTWADLAPTVLEWTGARGPEYPLHGRSLLPILDDPEPVGWEEVYASHTFHEVTMYYPVRVIRTRRYKLMLNLAHGLPFPFASDLQASPTWQGTVARGDGWLGRRRVEAYVHRPRWELYDLEQDPDELVNLAADPAHAAVRDELAARLAEWQRATADPWLVKYEYE